MSLVFPPSPPVEFDTAIDDIIAIFLAMTKSQRAQVAQILLGAIPDTGLGDPGPDIGNVYVNEGFLVKSQ